MGTLVKQKYECSFKESFLEKLWLPRAVLQIMDIGFVRFDKSRFKPYELNSFYVVMILNNGKTGIAKYNRKLQPTHLYITIDATREERYDLNGKLDGVYITEGDTIRRDDGTEYRLTESATNFSKLYPMIKPILNKDNDVFRFFCKNDGNVVYLHVTNSCDCEEKKPVQLKHHVICDNCKRLFKGEE